MLKRRLGRYPLESALWGAERAYYRHGDRLLHWSQGISDLACRGRWMDGLGEERSLWCQLLGKLELMPS